MMATARNNKSVCSLGEEVPTRGGNIVVYLTLVEPAQPVCDEFTMCQVEVTPIQLVALELIMNWNSFKND